MISRGQIAMSWALEARGISTGARLMLIILAQMVNNMRADYDVWPSHKLLGELCEMSVSSVRRRLEELEDEGFITRSQRFREDGGVTTSIYVLNVKGSVDLPKQRHSLDFAKEDRARAEPALPLRQIEHPPLQIDGGGMSTVEQGPLFTAEGCIEPKNFELKKKEEPPFSNEKGPPASESNLFGNADFEQPSEPPSLADHIEMRWRALKAKHPGIAAVRKIDDGLRHTIEIRAKQHAQTGQTAIDVWNEVLDAVDRSEFLTGRVPPGQGRDSPFKLTLAWLSNATKFRDVIGGKYDSCRDPARYHPDTGRRLGPTEQALASAISGLRAGAQPRPGNRDSGSAVAIFGG